MAILKGKEVHTPVYTYYHSNILKTKVNLGKLNVILPVALTQRYLTTFPLCYH